MKEFLETVFCVTVILGRYVSGFQTGVVRLKGGSGPHEGRVEIFKYGQWGTVDDDAWDDNDAGVVCRQLGYLFGGVGYRSAHFGEGSGPIWLDRIGCTGRETNLLACSHQTDTSEDTHAEDVGVACNGQVRLAGGDTVNEGRVEIFMKGEWGTLNGDAWDNDDASVVCRQLGYPPGGVAYKSAHFEEGTGPIWLRDIHCFGNEPHLLMCSYELDTSEDSHSEDVGVSCVWPGADACSSQPCVNNGQCIKQGASYVCVCSLGYTGSRCENDVDVCSSQPCANNGRCVNYGTSFICLCPVGYNGTRCENDINPCNNPCEGTEDCPQQENSVNCTSQRISQRTTAGAGFESTQSLVSLILAVWALFVATLCFIRISMISGTRKQQNSTSTSGTEHDRVQMLSEPKKYVQKRGGTPGSKGQPQGASCQSDDRSDIYEIV